MVHVSVEATAQAPIALTFDYVDDYRNAPRFLFGVQAFRPTTEISRGPGAVFDGSFHVTPVTLHTTIEVTDWEEHRLIAFRSVRGFAIRSSWEFAEDGPDRTRITVNFDYDLPGGLAGKALGKALAPIVALSARHSEEALRRQVEELHRGS